MGQILLSFISKPSRCNDLMVSALVSGSCGPGLSPDWEHCVVFLGKTLFTLAVPLSTQVHEWIPVNLTLGPG